MMTVLTAVSRMQRAAAQLMKLSSGGEEMLAKKRSWLSASVESYGGY